MKKSSMYVVRTRIYQYLETFHKFNRRTLKMLEDDNLIQLAGDYGFNLNKKVTHK